MSEDAESKSHAGRWVIVVVGALVLYVLSIGPVRVLAYKYDLTDTASKMLYDFYTPIMFCCERLGADELMLSYLKWWNKVFHAGIYETES